MRKKNLFLCGLGGILGWAFEDILRTCNGLSADIDQALKIGAIEEADEDEQVGRGGEIIN
jgi:hypothetical protein